jgi:hypothetical protein
MDNKSTHVSDCKSNSIQRQGRRARALTIVLTFSFSAMKNMLSVCVEISKAKGWLIVSSAPLIDKHLLTWSKHQHKFVFRI